jgi:DNA-3-methyladenine glycosylase II
LTDDELRAVYFSRQKTTYVRGLAHTIEDGDLDLASLETMSGSAIRERLTKLNGIGNWTVDVYLIIVLHRLDLFPAGDLAAVNGLRELKGRPRTTPVEELVTATQRWTPYRTIGTMLVWHLYLSRRAPRR